jgi:hypothetical protein
MSTEQKTITLTPSWKAFFWNYVLGILLFPVLIGIYILWRTWRKQRGHRYILHDRKITVVDGNYSQNIDLANIRNARAEVKRFGVGTVTLNTQGRVIELIGIENPEGIAASIEKAVEAELKRIAAKKKPTVNEAKFDPGTMDRLDYLTGLWQQGLMSEEDFLAEKRNLEKSDN